MDNGLPIVVFALMDEGNVVRAIRGEEVGTLICRQDDQDDQDEDGQEDRDGQDEDSGGEAREYREYREYREDHTD
jgi:hypothetical protein